MSDATPKLHGPLKPPQVCREPGGDPIHERDVCDPNNWVLYPTTKDGYRWLDWNKMNWRYKSDSMLEWEDQFRMNHEDDNGSRFEYADPALWKYHKNLYFQDWIDKLHTLFGQLYREAEWAHDSRGRLKGHDDAGAGGSCVRCLRSRQQLGSQRLMRRASKSPG